jgi:hypothetical protein
MHIHMLTCMCIPWCYFMTKYLHLHPLMYTAHADCWGRGRQWADLLGRRKRSADLLQNVSRYFRLSAWHKQAANVVANSPSNDIIWLTLNVKIRGKCALTLLKRGGPLQRVRPSTCSFRVASKSPPSPHPHPYPLWSPTPKHWGLSYI